MYVVCIAERGKNFCVIILYTTHTHIKCDPFMSIKYIRYF